MVLASDTRLLQPAQVAASWLQNLSEALQSKEVQRITSLFRADGWLRDLLVFTWDWRSLSGHEGIGAYLSKHIAANELSSFKLDTSTGLEPMAYVFPLEPNTPGVQFAFLFKTSIGQGKGFARLLQDSNGLYKALSLFLSLDSLHGHEEAGQELGYYGGHTLAWSEVNSERRRAIEENPYALIIGAGQNGLQVAARFRQMGIRALIVEVNPRVGDNWRKRYKTLTLHTPRTHHNFLYQPFPENWPTFTPRDKLATWMEQYAENQELVIWTSSHVLPTPKYDKEFRKWTVVVDKKGTLMTLHPSHIVLATGTLGKPSIPVIPTAKAFKGTILHASEFQTGEAYIGKRVVVVGAGNTSADICQDLVVQGAQSVTMVQRSSTLVASMNALKMRFDLSWPEGLPAGVADFRNLAMPWGLLRKISVAMMQRGPNSVEKTVLEQAQKGGLKVKDHTTADAGYLGLYYERFGGYWIDLGVAELIGSGKIKIKQGVEIENFDASSVHFSDGSTLEADVVIFATGYRNIRDSMKEIFGSEVIDQTSEVWGVNEEGELRGMYRNSGYPGLWYAAGDFSHSRVYSKHLGLQIKAMELGIL